ncbi:hypothetical protein HRR83_005192 [Exophiala dermatitidis]|uniref:Uncharacterized protein n=1 Tax=Exophiala dermatitidis TaxID=5970 RepID=A0AAN6EXA0_EXODE|nr:hypothetical protein HRR74_005044 [Exophiala dermatitidis]KAJ4518706.1 hypothetical protein HRR73_004287 [Exophiala dermatitidis]KAJ4534220.1 hypothetical protein HRR76_006153 [Exophiala dermatitidis]KAJ4550374.1 hypothetical protein HRR77_003840 [Exophiala dermatitidis]KAJ4563501.1 hypothetical protein HRR79_006380 [Exophiala dermatitidis]
MGFPHAPSRMSPAVPRSCHGRRSSPADNPPPLHVARHYVQFDHFDIVTVPEKFAVSTPTPTWNQLTCDTCVLLTGLVESGLEHRPTMLNVRDHPVVAGQ